MMKEKKIRKGEKSKQKGKGQKRRQKQKKYQQPGLTIQIAGWWCILVRLLRKLSLSLPAFCLLFSYLTPEFPLPKKKKKKLNADNAGNRR